ncbi:NUDIX hydrolase [Microbacterium gorillae]|uniref:NUDIX hydrolase n=1 Tax=Microbacterium gorillae TaxID=1231063 RepID=UPI00058EB783|nr:NUDIX domain-containing protein [Microbacterium gorillae]
MTPEIRVSAVLVTDPDGRALVVRKAGTERFMQPGGKPEPGESADVTAARELNEELGIEAPVTAFRPLGEHRAAAANEPGHVVVADAFALSLDAVAAAAVTAQAEIAELRWISPADVATTPLAPLSTDVLLPLLPDFR